MPLILHRALDQLSGLPHRVSAAFWLQAGAVAVVAWCLLHGGTVVAPAAHTPAGNAGAGSTGAAAVSDGAPARVDFLDMNELGRNPGRIIPAVREWVDGCGFGANGHGTGRWESRRTGASAQSCAGSCAHHSGATGGRP